MESTNQYPVYLGVWVNWSRGTIMGSTWTMKREDGNLLIALVAFFVAWVGTRLWRIICLVLHFVYSSQEPRDAIHHQRQVILRNSASPESGFLSLIYLALTWRRTKQPGSRYLHLTMAIVAAFIFIAGFTVASGFSSQVSMGSEVLVDGTHCAVPGGSFGPKDLDVTQYLEPYTSRLMNSRANYAQLCYRGNTETSIRPECRQFVKSRLPSTVDVNAPCPFDERLCKSRDQNLMIDTGPLDSHEHFGINAPPEERFQYRRVIRCAPLATENFTSTYTESLGRPYKRYYYGTTGGEDNTRRNHTYDYPNDAWSTFKSSGLSPWVSDYFIACWVASYAFGEPVPGNTNFVPIADFESSGDADLLLFFLAANEVTYPAPTNDPWYRATTLVSEHDLVSDDDWMNGTLAEGPPIYIRDEAASPLACKMQEQLCNNNLPEGSRCGPLQSSYDFLNTDIESLFPGQVGMEDKLLWLFEAAFGADSYIYNVPAMLGAHSLTARFGLSEGGTQGYLPDNQWMLDIEHWNNIILASLQSALVTIAAGPALSDPSVLPWYSRTPNNTFESSVCNNQKMASTDYSSVSVFGLLFILIVGSIIILVSFILDPLMVLLRKRYRIKEYHQLEWQTNDALQLHRLAHEEVGSGTWSKAAENIPITLAGETLALLDISDPQHPRLQRPLVPTPLQQQKIGLEVQTAEVLSPSEDGLQTDANLVAASPTHGSQEMEENLGLSHDGLQTDPTLAAASPNSGSQEATSTVGNQSL